MGRFEMNIKKRSRKVMKRLLGKKVARKIDYRLVGYGAAAYVGLRVMRRLGIFPTQAEAVLKEIDGAIGAVKVATGLDQTEVDHDHRRSA
jgi:hypothetical protein